MRKRLAWELITLGIIFLFVIIFLLGVYAVQDRKPVSGYANDGTELFIDDFQDVEMSTSYSEPIEVEDIEHEPQLRPVIYGNMTYMLRPDGLLERGGSIWRPVRVTTTAYTWRDDGVDHSIGAGDGKTANGTDAIRTYGYATSHDVLPLGTVIHVAGYGVFSVDDTGGAMRQAWRNNREIQIDLRIPQLRYDGQWRSVSECQRIARRHGRQRNRIVLIQVD
jgi:3D (Asp-Asp-Asp) domain-containing protein